MAFGAYQVAMAAEAKADLQALRAHNRKKVVAGIKTHLLGEPTKVSRSRIKQMVQPFWCQYRLRIEDFRVYYDVDEDKRTVTVLRVLEKGTEQTSEEQES